MKNYLIAGVLLCGMCWGSDVDRMYEMMEEGRSSFLYLNVSSYSKDSPELADSQSDNRNQIPVPSEELYLADELGSSRDPAESSAVCPPSRFTGSIGLLKKSIILLGIGIASTVISNYMTSALSSIKA